jgi:hypothetical protein
VIFLTLLVSYIVRRIRTVRRALSSMLRADDVVFLKGLASPEVLEELRKAVAARF